MYTPSQVNVSKFSQHLLSTPSNFRPVAPAPNPKYEMINGLLDKLQAKMNPQIQQANNNATMIHNYLAGQTQYPSYSHPNVGGGKVPAGQVSVTGTMPQMQAQAPQKDYSNYAQYIPHLQAMAQQVMQQRMPQVQDSVDLSPYTAFANSARNRSGGANV